MKRSIWLWFILMMSVIALTGSIIACGDDDDDDDDDAADDDDDAGDDDAAGDDDDDACSAENMCAFSVDCGLGYDSVEDCLAQSEAAMAGCTDADGYVACTCDCFLTDPTCTEYLACGMECYGTYCQ
ncbi:MAG TPA: hypothetical protein PK961_11840 [bacterium]|nr:hypothetical protein [bacterium]